MDRPLPVVTFADLEAQGFEVVVYCPRCHRWEYPELEGLGDRRFPGACFRCRTCGAPGHPSFRAPVAAIEETSPRADLYCGGCVPPWEMRDVRLGRPPWQLGAGEQFVCPGCRRRILVHVHQPEQHASPIGDHLAAAANRRH